MTIPRKASILIVAALIGSTPWDFVSAWLPFFCLPLTHAIAFTVVQDTSKAEGYSVQVIENVAIGRGLPGKKSGMSSSANGNKYTIARLYNTVKKIDP